MKVFMRDGTTHEGITEIDVDETDEFALKLYRNKDTEFPMATVNVRDIFVITGV